MKILIIVLDDLLNKSNAGIYNKINAIKKTFQKCLGPTSILCRKSNDLLLDNKVICSLDRLGRYRKNKSIWEKIYQVSLNYDAVYIRSILNNIFPGRFLRKYAGIKIIEAPTPSTNVLFEIIKSSLPIIERIKKVIELVVFQPSFYKRADLIVCMGNIGFLEKYFKKKIVLTYNGIDLDNIPISSSKNLKSIREITLIFVGNIAFWHGLDRVLYGIAKYNRFKREAEPEVYFFIVGEGLEKDNLKKLSNKLNISDKIIFKNNLLGEELNRVYEKCHIAIGSLGLYRIKSRSLAPLKHREYCARGIPFVISQPDPDWSPSSTYIYIDYNISSSLNIRSIINWYLSLIKNDPYYGIEMRKYAEEKLTWEKKFEKIIEKIKEIKNEG